MQVRGTGHEKTRFKVVLSCMADGTKLRPMVISKRKTKPKINLPSPRLSSELDYGYVWFPLPKHHKV